MFVVRRTLLAAALLGTVTSAAAQERVKYGRPVPPDRSPPLVCTQDGSATDWDHTEDGRCVFAICGADLRLCESGEVPLAQVRVHLRDRHRCPGHRAVSVMGMAAKFECDPAHRPLPPSTTTTVPRCVLSPDPDGTSRCVDGCPCDFDQRANGVCVIPFFCPAGGRGACRDPRALECRRGHVVRAQPLFKIVVPVGQRRAMPTGGYLRCVSR